MVNFKMCRTLESFVPNIVAATVGIGISVWAIVTIEYLHLATDILPMNYTSASAILFTAGLLILALPIVDCVSNRYIANKFHRILCVNVALILCSILLFISGVVACVLMSKLSNNSADQLIADLTRYGTIEYHDYTDAIDKTQSMMHCCGIYNYTDWKGTPWAQDHPFSIPKSCCKADLLVCGLNYTSDLNDIYSEGCYGPLTWHVRNILESIACSGFVLWVFVTYLRACMYVAKKSNHPKLSSIFDSGETKDSNYSERSLKIVPVYRKSSILPELSSIFASDDRKSSILPELSSIFASDDRKSSNHLATSSKFSDEAEA